MKEPEHPNKRSASIRNPWLLSAIFVIASTIAIIWWRLAADLSWPVWTGFQGRNLWDWMELLIVPSALAIIALLFNKSQKRTELLMADRRAVVDRQIAADRTEEETLQAYLDRMTELLLEKNLREASPESDLQAIAEARTTTTLARLDARRKGLLVCFLSAVGLIVVPPGKLEALVRLARTDLSHIDLDGAWLLAADLGETTLRHANLRRAVLKGGMLFASDLSGADMTKAVLRDAHLQRANLQKANLNGAFLQGADLSFTDLTEADLREADLSGANFLGANLTRAQVAAEQLSEAKCLQGATMPHGGKHD